MNIYACMHARIKPGQAFPSIFFATLAKEIIEKKLCQNITYKYRKNSNNNKSNKNQDLEKKKPRRTPKYPQNRKSNKDFSCELKTPVTNVTKIAKITNLTKF